MKSCHNPDTRRKMNEAFDSRGKKLNVDMLAKLCELRRERATILGYETHNHYILEILMAKTPEKVHEFLTSLADKLKPLRESDLKAFQKYKAESQTAHGFPTKADEPFRMWDYRYCMNLVEENDFKVDSQKLKEYFPLETVTKGLLEIYQTILSLKFKKVDQNESGDGSPISFHPDASVYSVTCAVSNKLIGYFYLDLHPRDDKFTHAACFDIQSSCRIVEAGAEKRVLGAAAMVANFTKPTASQPALLTHDEVETYFHEFGHVMHHICSETETTYFSGTNVERDFVEAPSQMLENWCWHPDSLGMMSGHYKTGEKLPADLLDSLIKSRRANAGIFNMRQIALAMLDQTIHKWMPKADAKTPPDAGEVYAEMTRRFMDTPATEGTYMPAAFGHLAGGYDCRYYGYLWSEVYCHDMFAEAFAKDVLNKEAGMKYRKSILSVGGSRDAMDSLREFLGREPDQAAFLKAKGVGA